jgi:hypothetical protein
MGDKEESKVLFEKAMTLRRESNKDDSRAVDELEDKDWKEPIIYWSR